MVNKLKQRKESGFTIIEVMIVLAIAGLIMVVVFLAVPALQRNGRNNAADSAANNILGAFGDYVSNNGGTLPTAAADVSYSATNNELTVGSITNTAINEEKIRTDASINTFTYVPSTAATAAITTSSNTGVFQVIAGTRAKCNAQRSGLDATSDASPRSYVVLYIAESGNGKILKCVGA